MGFCFGVRDAIEIVRELGQSGTPVYTLGAIVHNPQLAEDLEKIQLHVVHGLDEMPADSIVAITAHGAPPNLQREAEERGLRVVDTTCPLVTRIQKTARDLVDQRRHLLRRAAAGLAERRPGTLGLDAGSAIRRWVRSSGRRRW